MAEAKGGGTVELFEGFYVKASDVKHVRVTRKGKDHCVSVLYGADAWESDEMTKDEAVALAKEVNARVNDALGTTPTVITKETKKATAHK